MNVCSHCHSLSLSLNVHLFQSMYIFFNYHNHTIKNDSSMASKSSNNICSPKQTPEISQISSRRPQLILPHQLRPPERLQEPLPDEAAFHEPTEDQVELPL